MSNGTCPDIDVYKCSDKGLILPLINEYTWPIWVRAMLYLIGLLWCFLGVAIIADVFMCSIEKITSKTRTIKVASSETDSGYVEVEVKVWNDTVANLTLMALGSSAPEILLSCIEIVGNSFVAGDLGPSTIVGSAAFNLLVITAVCVFAIESPEVRTIKAIKVFAVTSFFCIFAYVWLIIILIVISPDYVELWEAIITFLYFPMLVILAFIADKDFCTKKKVDDSAVELGFARMIPWLRKKRYEVSEAGIPMSENEKGEFATKDGRMDDKQMRELIKDLKKLHPNLTEEDIARLAANKIQEETPHDHLWYRINATRSFGGSHKLTPGLNEQLHEVWDSLKEKEEHEDDRTSIQSYAEYSENLSKAVVEFTATKAAVLEQEGRVRVGIRRFGKTNTRVVFKLETIDGTAEAEKDYIPVKQRMVFEENEQHKYMDIEIIDDNEWEPDEIFFVKISLDPSDPSFQESTIGKKSIMEVTIINDDEPGTFEFAKPSILFKESAGKALIPVERSNGADGKVTVGWRTEDMSAHSPADYEGGEGTLIFEHGEMTKMLEIPIHDDHEVEKDECFKVELTELSPGAKLGHIQKTIVTIVNDDDFNGMVSRLVDLTNMNVDALRVDHNTWGDQFRNAMNVNGGDIDSASTMDYIMHFLTFAWKIIFALVPPPHIAGGWLAFGVALGMIGILTAIVGDLAGIFGCLVGLKDTVTAITFVALGTSLPDLFASKQAAQQEKTADNSIGNVTGSNSVNVFLGLGLPWTIAAIYWTIKDDTFKVKAGSLGFSVVIYTVTAILCVAVLMARRYLSVFGPGELGGKKGPKIATACFLCFLWLFYILMSSLQAYDHISGF